MPLPEIQLDDRNFEAIVADARRRIPGYTPEWTDLNESDPGIALVQLFAWLSEMIIWRLNRVPEKNFIKFLELIGVQLHPPAPARAELTFKLSAKDLPDAVLVPQGTRVSLADQVDGQTVIFETDDNLYAVGAELAALQSFDSAQFQLLTEANRVEGKFFYPLGQKPQKDSAFYLGFDRAFPPGRFTLTIHAYTAGRIAEGKGIPANFEIPPPPVVGVWEYWAGDQAKWRRLSVVDDTTGSLTLTGRLVFESPAAPVAVKLGLLRTDQDKPLFWFRFRIADVLGSGYPIPPQLEDVLLNTVSATNAVTVTDELLGASDGSPNQSFPLANAPVLLERFDLQVDEGDGFKSWKRVEDFAASGREDRHYTLDPSKGVVYFGDGEQGKIPERLTQPSRPNEDLPNIKAAIYRWGGGARGNAGAKKITSLQSTVPYVESVTNLRPSFGGQDEESVEDAKLRAPAAIRTQSRAVTAGDFEFLARQTPGGRIQRAHALPMRHPDFQPIRPAGAGIAAADIPVPGVVTVVVIPESLPNDPNPMPNEDTLKLVASWLDRHKLITTEVFAAAPKYRRVEIEAEVKALPTALSGQLADALEKLLLDYFHPLRGGADGTGWAFGGTISFSEIYRRILNTPGVARVEGSAVTIFVDGQRMPPCQDISLNPDELVYSTDHKIIVSYV